MDVPRKIWTFFVRFECSSWDLNVLRKIWMFLVRLKCFPRSNVFEVNVINCTPFIWVCCFYKFFLYWKNCTTLDILLCNYTIELLLNIFPLLKAIVQSQIDVLLCNCVVDWFLKVMLFLIYSALGWPQFNASKRQNKHKY